ncbi:hypothetical protein D3C81_1769160 [compost metagenome]
MQHCKPVQAALALGQQVHLHHAPVLGIEAALDQSGRFAAVDQCHHTVLLGLQAFGQLADRGPVLVGAAADMQQQQVLLHGQPLLARRILGKPQEAPQLVAEVRERLEVRLGERRRVAGRGWLAGHRTRWKNAGKREKTGTCPPTAQCGRGRSQL